MITAQKKNNIALFLALLFHVCGAIGILCTPYKEWFIYSTPVNVLLMAALLIFTQQELSFYFWLFVVVCFATGMAVEMTGVNTGLLFGHYQYGNVLGLGVFNVPWLIGVNWFIAVFCAGSVMYKLNEWIYQKLSSSMQPSFIVQVFSFVIDAAILTTFFDWVLEPVAIKLGFWQWLPSGEIPVFNFACWFVISAALLTAFRLMKFDKHNQFAVHLFIIQLLFFLVLQTFL